MSIGAIDAAGLSAAKGICLPAPTSPSSSGTAAEGGFVKIVNSLIGKANSQEAQAEQAVKNLALGQTDDIHNVALAVMNSDITFRLILEIRNRLTDAYQEITRMQI